MNNLEAWLVQIDDYFTITHTYNEQQRLAYVGLCTEDQGLKWCKANWNSYAMWEVVKDTIREYYSNHYKPDRVFNEINDLKQTGTVQKYLKIIHRLNVYAKITDHHLINIILNAITPCLRLAMAHYKDLRSDPSK